MRRETGQRCDRARHWVSLRVDGELSQLESALLDAHLASCRPCGEFVRDVQAQTMLLRTASLQRAPEIGQLRRAERRIAPLVASLAAAAALVVAMLLGGALRVHALVGGSSLKPTAMIGAAETTNAFRDLRREQLIAQDRPIPRNKNVF